MKQQKVWLTAAAVALVGVIVCLCITLSDEKIPENTDVTMAAAALPTTPAAKAAEPDDKTADKSVRPATATSTDVQEPVKTDKPAVEDTEEKITEVPVIPASAVKAVGVVNAADVNMRDKPSDGKVLCTLAKDTVVAITGSKDGWSSVRYGEQSGYVSDSLLNSKTKTDFTSTGKITADVLNVRSSPNATGDVVCQATSGAYVDVTGFENGWFAVTTNYGSGYVNADYLAIGVTKPAAKPVPPPAAAETTTAATASYSGTGADLAATAQQYLGCSYTYGGSGPSSFDCSGLTMYVYGLYGVSLPHGATGQMSYGTAVDKSNLLPGDLVFFSYGGDAIGHVGIYIGDGNFVHASTYGVGVITSSLDSGSYPSRYVGARRILQRKDGTRRTLRHQ